MASKSDIEIEIASLKTLIGDMQKTPLKFSIGELTVDMSDNLKYLETKLASLNAELSAITGDLRFREPV